MVFNSLSGAFAQSRFRSGLSYLRREVGSSQLCLVARVFDNWWCCWPCQLRWKLVPVQSWVVPVTTPLSSTLVPWPGTVVKLDFGEGGLTFNGIHSGRFGGGADADSFAGTVTIGGSDVPSGVAQKSTFNFSTITNVGDTGPAYFWNEGGTDSIVLGSFVSGASNYQSMGFDPQVTTVLGLHSVSLLVHR